VFHRPCPSERATASNSLAVRQNGAKHKTERNVVERSAWGGPRRALLDREPRHVPPLEQSLE
jgi:hypothetical protein